MLDVLERVHDDACIALPELRAQVEDPTARDSLLLYATLIELAGAVVALYRANSLVAVATVARSALDAFVEIRNLLRDANYWPYLEFPDHAEWRKTLELASAGGNPFLEAIARDPKLPAVRKLHKELTKHHKARGIAKLTAEERFERAGLNAEYWSLYAFLSSETHNNLSALIARHLTLDGNGKWVLDLYSGRAGYAHAVPLAVAEMLMHASNEMHDRFGNGRKRVESIGTTVEQARVAALAIAQQALPEGPAES